MSVMMVSEKKLKMNTSLFRGKHNRTKAKTLLWLYHLQIELGIDDGLPNAGIHKATGLSQKVLNKLLPRWVEFGYIKPKYVSTRGRPIYYSLKAKGQEYVERLPDSVRNELIDDINSWRNKKEAVNTLGHLFDPANHPGVKEMAGVG
jgi:hypothetical protein